jgi:hypothetical protein
MNEENEKATVTDGCVGEQMLGVVAVESGTGGSATRARTKCEGAFRRNGNVARLPKAVRDRVNLMILDGVPYGEIIEQLGEDGVGLDISNLSRWKDGGHQDWLVEQTFLELTRARRETPGELVRDFDATEVNHAALQLGTLHIFDALRVLEPGSLNKRLGGDCAAFARLINALARASRETMQLQKYRETCARARAALEELKDPNRKLNESETRAIVRRVDEILGLGGRGEEGDGTDGKDGTKRTEGTEGTNGKDGGNGPLTTDH